MYDINDLSIEQVKEMSMEELFQANEDIVKKMKAEQIRQVLIDSIEIREAKSVDV